jgi:hypothetical protein
VAALVEAIGSGVTAAHDTADSRFGEGDLPPSDAISRKCPTMDATDGIPVPAQGFASVDRPASAPERPMFERRALRGMLVAAVLACSAFLGPKAANAQGTSDLFPEPITSADMEAALDRIGVSGDARTASLRAFEEYIGRFLDLRKGDIEDYLQGRTDLGGGQRTREEVTSRVSARERLLSRIASIEGQLFDSIAALAGESGSVQAMREKLRAERRRDWAASSAFGGRGNRVELDEVLATVLERKQLTLPDAVRSEVDGLLRAHEESITGQYRKLLDAAVGESVAMHDAFATANLKRPEVEGATPPDPSAWSEYFRKSEAIRREVRAPQTAIRQTIRRTTRETANRVADALPADIGQAFRESFYARAYASIASPRDPVPPLVEEARKLHGAGDITADDLARIDAIASGHHARRNALTNSIAERIESERTSDNGVMFVFGEATPIETESESTKLLAERTKLDESSVAAITGVASKLADAVKAREERRTINIAGQEIALPEGGGTFQTATVMVMGSLDGAESGEPIIFTSSDGGELQDFGFSASISANGPQVGVVQAMQRDWVERLRRDYGIGESESTVLDLLHADYRSNYAEIEAGELAELKSLPAAGGGMVIMRTGEDAVEPERATAETTRRRFALKRSITERTIALDRDFFDALGAAFGDRISADEIRRLRSEREREAYLSADRGGMMLGGGLGQSRAATLDLAMIVRDAKLGQASLGALRGRLDIWDAAATDAFRQRFNERLIAQEGQEELERELEAQSRAEGRPGEVRIESGNDIFEKMEAFRKRADAADRVTRALNEGARDDLAALITDGEERRLLLDAWNRKAWPSVARDRRSVEPKIELALGVEGLTAEERGRVEAIAAEHRTEYRRILDEMIRTNEESEPKPGDDSMRGIDVAALRKRQETMNRLTFERDELNEKTFRRLRESLGEERAKQLGEMPARPKRGSGGLPAEFEGSIRIGG